VTVAAFLLGATGAGALAGAAAGALGALLGADSLGAGARLLMLGAAVLAAIAIDARGRPVPGPRRQVDERWLDRYRGWVYGLGYGAQLGLGVTTIVTSAATYVALLAAFLSAGALRGALVMGCYGAVRGLTPLTAARIRSPQQLIALHGWLERRRQPVALGAVAVLAAIMLAALGGGVAWVA
jgi:hypothetical protein